jgi:HEPN domain-containing protein
MPPEESRPGSPQDWLRYARSDLGRARAVPSGGILLETLCFHAQQAAETLAKGQLFPDNAYGRAYTKGGVTDGRTKTEQT